MDIAETIWVERRLASLTARKLAILSDVSPSTITRIEKRELDPTINVAQRILAVFGLSLDCQPVTNASVLAAARKCLDPTLEIALDDDACSWVERWQQLGIVDLKQKAIDRAEVAWRAGREPRLV